MHYSRRSIPPNPVYVSCGKNTTNCQRSPVLMGQVLWEESISSPVFVNTNTVLFHAQLIDSGFLSDHLGRSGLPQERRTLSYANSACFSYSIALEYPDAECRRPGLGTNKIRDLTSCIIGVILQYRLFFRYHNSDSKASVLVIGILRWRVARERSGQFWKRRSTLSIA